MNNLEKQQFLIELDNSINEIIKSHNENENFIIIGSEIDVLVNNTIKSTKKDINVSYKESQKLYKEMFDKAVNILVHCGFEYRK